MGESVVGLIKQKVLMQLSCAVSGVQLGVIPDPPLLKSLAIISSAEQKMDEKVTAETAETVKEADIPPKKLAQKILNGEHVDFLSSPLQKEEPDQCHWTGRVRSY